MLAILQEPLKIRLLDLMARGALLCHGKSGGIPREILDNPWIPQSTYQHNIEVKT
jgi:hypothetical protein